MMRLAEIIQQRRTELGMSREELAKKLKLNLQTVSSYEEGNSYPRSKKFYETLAQALQMKQEELYGEFEEFMVDVGTIYGQRGQKQAMDFFAQAPAMFAGGNMTEEEKEKFRPELQEIFMQLKDASKQKYGSRKARA